MICRDATSFSPSEASGAASCEKLRVLLVCSYQWWRALEGYSARIAEGLIARGHEVHFAVRRGSKIEAAMKERGIRTLPVAPRNVVDLPAALRLAWALRTGGYHLAHAQYTRDYGPVVFAGRLAHVPVVLTRHVVSMTSARRIRSMKRASRVIAVSEAVRTILTDQFGLSKDLVVTAYAGLDPSRFQPLTGPRQELPRLGIAQDVPVFGMVTRVEDVKRLDTFIRAAAILKEKHPSARYVIVGAGDIGTYEALARELGVADDVLLTGYAADSAALLREFNAFVAPGELEAFSAAILEAMGCAVPVLASRKGGNVEAVVEGETGLLFPVGDEAALAAAMQTIVENPEQARKWGAAGRLRLETKFNLKNELDSIERIYREVGARQS